MYEIQRRYQSILNARCTRLQAEQAAKREAERIARELAFKQFCKTQKVINAALEDVREINSAIRAATAAIKERQL
jgi:hypothetical protein